MGVKVNIIITDGPVQIPGMPKPIPYKMTLFVSNENELNELLEKINNRFSVFYQMTFFVKSTHGQIFNSIEDRKFVYALAVGKSIYKNVPTKIFSSEDILTVLNVYLEKKKC